MYTELSDELCIKQFQETHGEAVFNCLLNRHRNSLRRIIYSILRGSREDMEDVEQEIALALYLNLPFFSFRSSYTTYLYRLCRNKAIDYIRKKEKHKRILKKTMTLKSVRYQETPDEILLKKDISTHITKTLFQLSEIERSLIILKDVEHLSLETIADIFNKPVGTIKSRLHRARMHAVRILKMMEVV